MIGAAVARLHREHGVSVLTDTGVGELCASGGRGASGGPAGRVTGVRLTSGEVVPADCVLVAIGAAPDTGCLRDAGLPAGDGVECDQYCRAAPGIYAAGDVASWVNPRCNRRMRVEHRMNATEMGATAAKNLLAEAAGTDLTPFDPVPYFWSDQYKVKIQVHGELSADAEVTVEEGAITDGKFVALFRHDGVPSAVLGWNSAARVIAYRKQLLG
jgi:3-phenylpropionate/trans-cinnamate dioxygenase ferredoxin reductase component